MADEAFGSATLRRVEWLTLALGGLGTVWAATRWGWRGALGVVIGTALSWLNFRWLKGGVQAFGRAATEQAGSPNARVPVSAYVKFIGRFGLLLVVVYVILTHSWVPPVPLFAGLFASAAGVVVGAVWEVASSGVRQGASRGT
ncbi:MAG TPA: ATP synthase subunit I [Candidatus Angelobacter sp.]|nr:ATP synthase subunit I [Candidatus Angelobacter sp.]